MVLLLTAPGCAGRIDFVGLVTGGRDGWQQPARVIEVLAIEPGDRVAEIGAGDGYWLPWLSEAVGPDGVVYAVEVEEAKVEALRERVEREGMGNVEVILGRYEDPLLPDAAVDLAMTCLTYHHIEERAAYFERLHVDLAPGGRVAHIDARDDLSPPVRWLPTSGHWSNFEEMDAEMAQAGYTRQAAYDFLLMENIHLYAPAPAPALSGRSGD